jgi:hypothetical protein
MAPPIFQTPSGKSLLRARRDRTRTCWPDWAGRTRGQSDASDPGEVRDECLPVAGARRPVARTPPPRRRYHEVRHNRGRDHRFRHDAFTASLNALPAPNFTVVLSGTWISAPVDRLRPVRAARRPTEDDPNPTSSAEAPSVTWQECVHCVSFQARERRIFKFSSGKETDRPLERLLRCGYRVR